MEGSHSPGQKGIIHVENRSAVLWKSRVYPAPLPAHHGENESRPVSSAYFTIFFLTPHHIPSRVASDQGDPVGPFRLFFITLRTSLLLLYTEVYDRVITSKTKKTKCGTHRWLRILSCFYLFMEMPASGTASRSLVMCKVSTTCRAE